MAITTYATGDSLAVKAWARDLATEVKKGLEIAPLIGIGPNSIIQEKKELKAKGDQNTGVTTPQELLDMSDEEFEAYKKKHGSVSYAFKQAS